MKLFLDYGSQDLYFMIIHSSITLNTAKPGAHSIIMEIVLFTGFIFYISLRRLSRIFSRKIPERFFCKPEFSEQYSGTFCNSGITFQKFPDYGKKSSQNSGFPEPFPQWKWKIFLDLFRT